MAGRDAPDRDHERGEKTREQAEQAAKQAREAARKGQRTARELAEESAYAALGAGDAAAEFVRHLSEQVKDVPRQFTAMRDQAPDKVKELREAAISALESLRAQASEEYAELTQRGKQRAEAAERGKGASAARRQRPSGSAQDSRPLEERTVGELRERAAELDIAGRSRMSKSELVEAIRSAQ